MLKKKYKFKIRKNHFFFVVKKIAKLYIRRTYTNIFITLCDLNDKVIVCKTSGSSDNIKNKRRKRIAQAVEKIMLYIRKTMKLYKLLNIYLILKMKVKSHVYTLLNRIKYYGLNIINISSRRAIAHNGVK